MSVESFRGLFRDKRRVVIPMIQRDYAQGREDYRSQNILTTFLDELRKVVADPSAKPLDLDFVYGRWHDETRVLEPLDGQQRLTTLFLLHWYLAQRDGHQADFRSWLQQSGHSCFSYRTRQSAEEFIDALVAEDVEPVGLPEVPRTLSEWIADRTWFLRAWRRDPTVAGCLSALDVIHERFRDLEDGYERIADLDAPRVTFHLLYLHDFQLSDDLYVKMNARGKPLTPFEIFKAELQLYIEDEFADEPCCHDSSRPWKDYVSDRMDREWTDFLWHHRDKQTHEIDSRFVQLVRAIALIHCALEADPDKDVLDEQVERLLVEPDPNLDFYRQIGCLNRGFVEHLVASLDVLAVAPEGHLVYLRRKDYFDEQAAFESLLTPDGRFGISLPDWAKFAAYGMFLLARAADQDTEDTDDAHAVCHEWMRVVCNLVNNSDIDRVERLVVALKAIAQMHVVGAGDVFLDHVADDEELARGFNREQRIEERIKANLIRHAPGWRPIIERAETHSYFRGDLQFLLRFSQVWDRWHDTGSREWPDELHVALQGSVLHWYDRACAIFPPDHRGLGQVGPTQEFLWERALLTRGDYLLRRGQNMSLLDDLDRDASWKRLLRGDTKIEDHAERRAVVQHVMESLDPADPADSLRTVVNAGPEDDAPMWRRLLASNPRLIAECKKRMLRFDPQNTIHLLATTQLNGRHVDLFTYALFLKAIARWDGGELQGFEKPEHNRIVTQNDRCKLTLKRTTGDAVLVVMTERMETMFHLEVAERWSDTVVQSGYVQIEDKWERRVPLEEADDALLVTTGLFTD